MSRRLATYISTGFVIVLLAVAGIPRAQAEPMTLLEVTSAADAGPVSLRWALQEARGLHGPYGITLGDADGPFSTPRTIELSSPLPPIVGDVSIDGRIDGLLWEAYSVTFSGSDEHHIYKDPTRTTGAGARRVPCRSVRRRKRRLYRDLAPQRRPHRGRLGRRAFP